MNQCDGCLAGMPVKNDLHCYNGGTAFMACTAERYKVTELEKAAVKYKEYVDKYTKAKNDHAVALDNIDLARFAADDAAKAELFAFQMKNAAQITLDKFIEEMENEEI